MTVKGLFDFITDPTITEQNMDKYLDTISEQMAEQNNQEIDPKQQIEEQVFKQAYIPQNLTQVMLRNNRMYSIEREVYFTRYCVFT